MLPCHFTHQIGRDLGGIRKGLTEHKRKPGDDSLGILFRNIKLRMLGSQYFRYFPGRLRLIVLCFSHAYGKAFHPSAVQ